MLVPFSFDDLLEEFDVVAEEIGEAWPKDVSAVGAVREDGKSEFDDVAKIRLCMA